MVRDPQDNESIPRHGPSPKARLSPDAITKLRVALEHWVRDDEASDSRLRDALHAVAAEAREHGVHPEELLVTLKTTWFEIAGASSAPQSTTSSDQKRLDELVTACIKAYYG